jgi:hypothetical protein
MLYIYMLLLASSKCRSNKLLRGRRGRNRVVVGFITTYAISAYHPMHQYIKINVVYK